MLMLQLKVEKGLDQGKTFALFNGEHVVGRSSKCNWQLPSDDRVSRRHCLVQVMDGRVVLSNLSDYGTFLEPAGVEIDGPVTLRAGLSFRLGHSETQIGVESLPDGTPATSEIELKSTFLSATSIQRMQSEKLFEDGPLTRDAPLVTEAFCKKEMASYLRTRVLTVVGFVLGLAVGTLVIWRLLWV